MILRTLLLTLSTCGLAFADNIDDYVQATMAREHIPGLSLAILQNGTILRAQGYGLADLENDVAVQPDTVFKIGSVSKQFIAAGILLLVQDGKLALDDHASKFIPGTPATWRDITVRHLLTHTSGLIREAPGFDGYRLQPDLNVIKSTFSQPLLFAPGEKYEYSNAGYFVLAEIMQIAAAKPWPEFLAERIFIPLGMTATRATTAIEIVPHRARGYLWSTGKFENAEDYRAVRPSGAFLSTVLDLSKWEAALRTSQILTPASKAAMWTGVALNNGHIADYGFGWELNDFIAGTVHFRRMRHEGTMPGFRAGFSRWPDLGLAIVVLTNLDNAPVESIADELAILSSPEFKAATASAK